MNINKKTKILLTSLIVLGIGIYRTYDVNFVKPLNQIEQKVNTVFTDLDVSYIGRYKFTGDTLKFHPNRYISKPINEIYREGISEINDVKMPLFTDDSLKRIQLKDDLFENLAKYLENKALDPFFQERINDNDIRRIGAILDTFSTKFAVDSRKIYNLKVKLLEKEIRYIRPGSDAYRSSEFTRFTNIYSRPHFEKRIGSILENFNKLRSIDNYSLPNTLDSLAIEQSSKLLTKVIKNNLMHFNSNYRMLDRYATGIEKILQRESPPGLPFSLHLISDAKYLQKYLYGRRTALAKIEIAFAYSEFMGAPLDTSLTLEDPLFKTIFKKSTSMDLRERIDNAHTAWHSSELFLYPFTYILGERPGFQEYFDILPYDEQIFRNNIDSIKIQLKQQFSKQQFVKKTEIE